MYRFCAKHDQRYHHPCMKSELTLISKNLESIKTQMKNRTFGMNKLLRQTPKDTNPSHFHMWTFSTGN